MGECKREISGWWSDVTLHYVLMFVHTVYTVYCLELWTLNVTFNQTFLPIFQPAFQVFERACWWENLFCWHRDSYKMVRLHGWGYPSRAKGSKTGTSFSCYNISFKYRYKTSNLKEGSECLCGKVCVHFTQPVICAQMEKAKHSFCSARSFTMSCDEKNMFKSKNPCTKIKMTTCNHQADFVCLESDLMVWEQAL